MKKLIFLLLSFCISFAFYSQGQERQDEVRKKLQTSIDAQSEILSKVKGWSKVETNDGKFWKQSDSTSTESYFPNYPDHSFHSLQMYKFTIEGETFYCLKMILNMNGKFNLTFYKKGTFQEFEKFINTSKQGDWDASLAISYCMDSNDELRYDLSSIFKNKELIRKLILGDNSANAECGARFFMINSEILKGAQIFRFRICTLPDYSNNATVQNDNYFEVKKSDFERLFKFTPYDFVSEKKCIETGDEKYNLKDYAGAISEYSKAIEINPIQHKYYISRANFKTWLNDWAGAKIDYSKALELITTDHGYSYRKENGEAEISASRALCEFKLNNFSGAVEDCNNAIVMNSSLAEAWYRRGYAKIKLGQKESGCADLSKAVELGDKDAIDLKKQYCQ